MLPSLRFGIVDKIKKVQFRYKVEIITSKNS